MGFSELIGHSNQIETLRRALLNDRLHHAYLFLGPDGVGKRTLAMALAQAIHCSELQGDYCGRCVNCASIIHGNHADVRFIGPLLGKKEIAIQQIRELERELRFRSFGGKQKIAIVDPVTLMNAAAQNALLKTLEEPPAKSLIILIAPNGGGLLPTVRSRCLRLSFAPLPCAEVAAFLQAKHRVKAEEAAFLAAMATGSIGVALSLDQEGLIEKRKTWTEMLGSLKPGDYQAAVVTAEALAATRNGALEFFKWAESWYRDLLVYRVTRNSEELVNLDMLAQIEQQAAASKVENSLAAMAGIADAAAGIQRNLNRRMVLEKLLFGVVGAR
ncbi:MAG TPA: DNA polymerase III subunit delta' [Candidatus Binatia bacterium]|jgi:DNA polymerase-3 subunit delta'